MHRNMWETNNRGVWGILGIIIAAFIAIVKEGIERKYPNYNQVNDNENKIIILAIILIIIIIIGLIDKARRRQKRWGKNNSAILNTVIEFIILAIIILTLIYMVPRMI